MISRMNCINYTSHASIALNGIRVYRNAYMARYYSTPNLPKPEIDRRQNILYRAINYVKNVDEYEKNIEKVPDREKASELIKRIRHMPELLFMLSLFHWEVSKIGLNQQTDTVEREKLKWKYRIGYILKYSRIHNIFWEQCAILEISQHKQKLNFSSQYLGILDPINFDKEVYQKLQTGVFNGVDFRDIKCVGISRKFLGSSGEEA